ncbi:hypothetical protein C9374_001550 [Naegleria lovaniensis]|uniref:Uncharacterized protein n=1 Tax=Naegleria lovaniensis TaxID=51637 RepID=A0AA88KM26_NAELO|nr:uncharacterized protein C9374_001550 [Naegleria lovaniensis]KAG2387218.1 hypothetical protein C9374_001550 [Naegleria lovaniensis]
MPLFKKHKGSQLLEEEEDLVEELDDVILSSSSSSGLEKTHPKENDEEQSSPVMNTSSSAAGGTTTSITSKLKHTNDDEYDEPHSELEKTPAFKDDRSKLRVRFENINKEEEAQDLETPPQQRKQILVSKHHDASPAVATSSNDHLLPPHLSSPRGSDDEDDDDDMKRKSDIKISLNNEHDDMQNVGLDDDVEIEITGTTKIPSSKQSEKKSSPHLPIFRRNEYEESLLYSDSHIDDPYADYLKPQAMEEETSNSKNVLLKIVSQFPRINISQLMWLVKMSFHEFWLATAGTLFLLISTGLGLALPIYAGKIIDQIPSQAQGKTFLNEMALVLFGIVAAIGATTAIRNFCFTFAGERAVARLRKNLFTSIIVQELGFFDVTKTGELINRLSSDTKTLENAITVNFSMFLRYSIQMIGGVIFLFIISWKLTLVMLAVIPALVVVALIYSKYNKNVSKQMQDALANSTDVAEETLSNLRTVRSFTMEEKHANLYGTAIDLTLTIARKLSIINGVFTGGMTFCGNAAIILVLWYGGSLVLDEELSIGSLLAFIVYTILVAASFGVLSGLLIDLVKALGATVRIHELLQRIPEIERRNPSQKENDTRELPTLNGHLVFHDVGFAYPSRKEIQVLNHLNLELSPSTVMALVGKSGHGKTTIASLLQRFYDPTEGQITLDGVPLTQIDPMWLRRNIGVVSQEPTLFPTQSIRDNICYGWKDAENAVPTEKQLMDVAKKANVNEFVSALEDGYDTLVGATTLTSSQKQRIAIARAMLKDPKILIVDEHSSSLDANTDHELQEALNRLMEGRTVLIIAHRLSTVKNADVVCVIENGSVVEEGSHEQLIVHENGKYKALVERQLIGFEEV